MAGYQTVKKTFSLRSENQPIEQASLGGGEKKEKKGFLLIFLDLFYCCLKK
jgi:hypothetical protein